MIIEILHLSQALLLGYLCVARFVKHLPNGIRLGMSYPVGFVAIAAISFLLFIFPIIPLSISTLSLGWAVACLALMMGSTQKLLSLRDAERLVLGATLLVLAVHFVAAPILTSDSYHYLLLANNIVVQQHTPLLITGSLANYGALVPFGMSSVGFTEQDFFPTMPVAMSLSILAMAFSITFQWPTIAHLSRWPRFGFAIATCAILSLAPQYFIHSFYMMPNIVASAIFMAAACLFSWGRFQGQTFNLIDGHPDVGWMTLLAFILMGFGFVRLEAPLIVILFVISGLSLPALIKISYARRMALAIIPIIFWVLYLILSGSSEINYILDTKSALAQMGILVLTVIAIRALVFLDFRFPSIDGPIRFGVKIIPWALTAICIALYLLNPDHAGTTLSVFIINLFSIEGQWGASWALVILIWGAAALNVRNEDFDPLPYILVSFVLVVLALGIYRFIPYRIGAQDSGNRMMLHLFPTALTFGVLKLCERLSSIGQSNVPSNDAHEDLSTPVTAID